MSDEVLPTVDDLKGQLQVTKKNEIAAQGKFEGKFKLEAAQAQAEYAHLVGLQDHYKHKGNPHRVDTGGRAVRHAGM